MKRPSYTVYASLVLPFALLMVLPLGVAVANPQVFQPGDFPPSTAAPTFAIRVGGTVNIGGPGSANFLPNTRMDVFVVPHRTWREGDPLATNAVKQIKIKSDAQGALPLTELWKADRAGQFDIIVDYDGNGKFSYALDALHSFVVIGDIAVSAPGNAK